MRAVVVANASPRDRPAGKSPGERLTRAERVRRRPDYLAAYERGTRLSGRLMTVFLLDNGQASARLGIAATRKLGDAVERNRAKRLVRETFRRNKPQAGFDIVVIPRREMLVADFVTVQADYRAILKRRLRRTRET